MKKLLVAYKKTENGRVEKWNIYTWDWPKMKKTKNEWESEGFTVFVYEVKEDAEN